MAFNYLNKDGLQYFWNKIKAKIGTATLTTTAQDLSGAVNELNSDLDNIDYPKNISITFNAPVCKTYYGAYQLFIPVHKTARYNSASVGNIEIYYNNTTPSISTYKVNTTPTGYRIEFNSNVDYSGYLGAAHITFS